ncbi:hypothetical protein LI328DRAFT_168832 [Trichoderma asperelloides]|nr:hypothetical protein LI328DRAFT_168832 [Trichoderma asperelloides]
MYECETCTKEFYSARSCEQHMNGTGHFGPRYGCGTCTRQHMDSLNHWAPRFPCEICSIKFHTERAAEQHMQAKGHYQNYCKPCDKHFQNGNNFQMHLNSKIHRGVNVPCPFCQTGFTSASGLSYHLETGSCINAPSLNRERILALVRKRDPHGVITNKQIQWRDEESSTYEANHLAYNVYHCPNRRGGCAKQFVSLAGLFNHLESETCSFMRFDKVQQHASMILDGRRFITF